MYSTFPNFHTAVKHINQSQWLYGINVTFVSRNNNTDNHGWQALYICVSQHRMLFDERDTNDKNSDVRALSQEARTWLITSTLWLLSHFFHRQPPLFWYDYREDWWKWCPCPCCVTLHLLVHEPCCAKVNLKKVYRAWGQYRAFKLPQRTGL